jgi:hypothetical protein
MQRQPQRDRLLTLIETLIQSRTPAWSAAMRQEEKFCAAPRLSPGAPDA